MNTIACDRADGHLRLEMRQPVLTGEMLTELERALTSLRSTAPDVPLVLTSAHRRIFLAGADLAEIARLGPVSAGPYADRGRRVMTALGQHPAPVVAAVDGPCTGGGFDLVMACDLVVAGPGARFSHPGVRRGLVTGWGGTATLPARIGRRQAAATLLEAGVITAAEAARLGLAEAADADPYATAAARAIQLASFHPARLTTWRTTRDGRFVDRFRLVMVHTKGGVWTP